MDTRNKIVTPGRAAELVKQIRERGAGNPRIARGFFDVLVAEHVRRLRELRDGAAALFVLVGEPASPVLDQRARAELVAALAVVDYVVPAGQDAARELLRHFREDEIVTEESADLRRTQWLTEHVQHRHQR